MHRLILLIVTALIAAMYGAAPSLAASPNQNSPLGTNLSGIADWTSETPFIDIFKTSRAWISGNSATGTWYDGRALDVDANGWVRSLQADQIARTLMLTDFPHPAGKYTVIYDGKGTIEYFDNAVKDTSLSRPGRDVVRVDATWRGRLFGLFITATDSADYIRNIRVIMPGGTCASNHFIAAPNPGGCPRGDYIAFNANNNDKTLIFHPTFLQTTRRYSALRFMDWMATNDSAATTWATRPKPSDARWSVKGVPVETMVTLANRLNADPWFNMPHAANNAYISGFAAAVKKQLAPGRKAYVEYSNEVWNSQFPQAAYAMDRGTALGLSSDRFQAGLFYYSLRSQQIFDLWTSEFGGTQRLGRVMAMQAANPWTGDQVLGFRQAARKTDALAIAPYFGEVPFTQAEIDAIMSLTLDQYIDKIKTVMLPQVQSFMTGNKAIADKYQVAMIAYEGGQHFVTGPAFWHHAAVNARFDAVNRDPRIKQIYLDYLGLWKAAGGQMFAHFVNCSKWSFYGRWGALEYATQPLSKAPKYDALMKFIAANPKWW